MTVETAGRSAQWASDTPGCVGPLSLSPRLQGSSPWRPRRFLTSARVGEFRCFGPQAVFAWLRYAPK